MLEWLDTRSSRPSSREVIVSPDGRPYNKERAAFEVK